MVTGLVELSRQTRSMNWSFSSYAHERDGRMRCEQHCREWPSPMALMPATMTGMTLFLNWLTSKLRLAGLVSPSSRREGTRASTRKLCSVTLKWRNGEPMMTCSPCDRSLDMSDRVAESLGVHGVHDRLRSTWDALMMFLSSGSSGHRATFRRMPICTPLAVRPQSRFVGSPLGATGLFSR